MKYYLKFKNGVLMYDDIQRKERYIKRWDKMYFEKSKL